MWLTAPRSVPCSLHHVRSRNSSDACHQRAPLPPRALLSFLDKSTTQQPKIETIECGEQLQRITDPSVNVVWWPRPLDVHTQHAVAQALQHNGLFKHQVIVDAQSASTLVTSLFPEGPLRSLLADDAVDVVQRYLHALGTHHELLFYSSSQPR